VRGACHCRGWLRRSAHPNCRDDWGLGPEVQSRALSESICFRSVQMPAALSRGPRGEVGQRQQTPACFGRIQSLETLRRIPSGEPADRPTGPERHDQVRAKIPVLNVRDGAYLAARWSACPRHDQVPATTLRCRCPCVWGGLSAACHWYFLICVYLLRQLLLPAGARFPRAHRFPLAATDRLFLARTDPQSRGWLQRGSRGAPSCVGGFAGCSACGLACWCWLRW